MSDVWPARPCCFRLISCSGQRGLTWGLRIALSAAGGWRGTARRARAGRGGGAPPAVRARPAGSTALPSSSPSFSPGFSPARVSRTCPAEVGRFAGRRRGSGRCGRCRPRSRRHAGLSLSTAYISTGRPSCSSPPTRGMPLGWHLCRSENSRAWAALMPRVAAPEVVVSDGGDGFAKALRETWPRTRHQRCVFHAFS